MLNFNILNALRVKIPNATYIKEVFWSSHLYDWIKCNTDRTSIGVPSIARCGRIFRNSNGDHLGSFSFKIESENTFVVELTDAMIAIEITSSNI